MQSALTNTLKSRIGLQQSIIDTIGRTPIIKLQRLSPRQDVEVYVKLESENPGGSVKDRLAYGVIEWAEKHGQLQPGQTVIEASSGNTGIGLAMVCASKGYPLVCVMSEAFSIERRKLMRFFGAKVILTNPAHKASGMLIKCKELTEKHGYFWPNQFENEANAWIHEQTTAPEIVQAFQDDNKILNHLVLSYGTGGTVLGCTRYLHKHSPDTKIHLCEPSNAPMLYSKIPTEYNNPTDPVPKNAHPVWRPHLLQGWATDFIPRLVQTTVSESGSDIMNVIPVSGNDAIETSRAMARLEGIFSGTSGGGIVSAALQLAKDCKPGSTILAIVPDTAERYLSTPLFDNIPADMTAEEKELAASTPSQPPPPVGLPDVLPEAVEFVKEQNANHKVVVWSLEYCEFCWTLTKFLNRLNISYTKIDIDNFIYAKDNMGNKYRAALSDITKINTFPQLFINNTFIGGAVDACQLWKKGELQSILDNANISYAKDYNSDPFEFLPKWMTANPLGDK